MSGGVPAGRGPDVTPADAAAAAAGDERVVLLDVREPDEWAAGHAAGARHVPLGELRPEAIDPGATVITVCRSGNRSARAAELLAAAGIEVRNMAGGMLEWARLGLHVVAEDGAPGTV